MSNAILGWMADELRAAGLTVQEPPGWETNTAPTGNTYTPRGVVNHHTAGTGYTWPYTFLADKCNLLVRPDGTVATMNAGYAYDSGRGAVAVLDAVTNDQPITWAQVKNYTSTILGNPYFIDIEVEHKGDGSPIPRAQYAALIRCNVVLCTHFGWNPTTRVIGHYEWAPDRKIDPYWNGAKYDTMPTIRADTAALMGGVMGYALPETPDSPVVEVMTLQAGLNELGETLTVDGAWGPLTSAAKKWAVGGAAEVLTAEEVWKLVKRIAHSVPPKTHSNKQHSPDFALGSNFQAHVANLEAHGGSTGNPDHEARIVALENHSHDEGQTGPPVVE